MVSDVYIDKAIKHMNKSFFSSVTLLHCNAHMGQYGWGPNFLAGALVCVYFVKCEMHGLLLSLLASCIRFVFLFCAWACVVCVFVSHIYQCFHHVIE